MTTLSFYRIYTQNTYWEVKCFYKEINISYNQINVQHDINRRTNQLLNNN